MNFMPDATSEQMRWFNELQALSSDGENAVQLVSDMHTGLEQSDTEKVGRAAHTLKSNSANLGARNLSATCRTLEEQARAGDLSNAPELVPAIELQLERALDLLQRERTRAAA